MKSGSYRFDRFELDFGNRQLSRDGTPVELNARYLDALALLVREGGQLVSKDRFLDEVWRGVPVTDEALTQCIKMLRRQLGDSAGDPRFIETVPKHGYRFIAPVVQVMPDGEAAVPPFPPAVRPGALPSRWSRFWLLGGAGTLGGGFAGAVGGLIYGFAGASQPLQPGAAALSVLLVLLCLTTLMALVGGAGVAFGMAGAGLPSGQPWRWSALGGAAGGLVVGAFVRLIGLDAFNLLFGHAPADMTGATEGLLLGGGVGVGGWLAHRPALAGSLRRRLIVAGAAGGAAGLVIPLLGGTLMGGSLDLLARAFPASRFRLDRIGSLLGEHGFALRSATITGALEGALFGTSIIGAMVLAERHIARAR